MEIICKLVGANFRPSDAKIALSELDIGDQLFLERDPTNPYDANAVKVLTASGVWIGFIPRDHNFDLAQALDAETDYTCEVLDREEMLKPTLKISVDVD